MWFCRDSVSVIKYSVSVPYLSPIVLRKELEMLMDQRGERCLESSSLVDDHAVIFWNLVCVLVCFGFGGRKGVAVFFCFSFESSLPESSVVMVM